MALGPDVPIGVWSGCPRGAIRHPMLIAALEIDAQAQISPLHAWPDTYSAAVVDCLCALHTERRLNAPKE